MRLSRGMSLGRIWVADACRGGSVAAYRFVNRTSAIRLERVPHQGSLAHGSLLSAGPAVEDSLSSDLRLIAKSNSE
jgi:hypothetical protein